jgi:hypothetical protein
LEAPDLRFYFLSTWLWGSGLCSARGYVQVVCGRGRSRAPVPLKLLAAPWVWSLVQHRIPGRRSRVVRFRVWNTSSLVILTAAYPSTFNTDVFCTVAPRTPLDLSRASAAMRTATKALGIKRYFFGPLLRASKVILLLPKVILLPPKVVQKAPRGPF